MQNRTLVVDLGRLCPVLSSAPLGGGLVRARYILNHQVQANPIGAPIRDRRRRWPDPSRSLSLIARRVQADCRSVGMMTAVPLAQLVTLREEAGGLWVEGFFTVGVTNAVRAGEPTAHEDRVPVRAGTINLVLVTNARLTSSALVGAVQVATEGKTAALLAAKVPSWTGRSGATGTGTDTVVVACGAGPAGPSLRYSGTHTRIGAMIGRLVSRGVAEGLRRSRRWKNRKQ
ncbi:MAG: adenosylcobinamide amidohydrolase [Nitrospirota bacterium]